MRIALGLTILNLIWNSSFSMSLAGFVDDCQNAGGKLFQMYFCQCEDGRFIEPLENHCQSHLNNEQSCSSSSLSYGQAVISKLGVATLRDSAEVLRRSRRGTSTEFFGAEFVFTGTSEDAAAWLSDVRNKCNTPNSGCRVKGGKVVFSSGLWYAVDTDIGDVVEVTASPQTLNDWTKNKNFWQTNIFDYAAFRGLKPATRNGGHIHLDVSHFHEDPVLFMNFFIDCQNYPELFLGALGVRGNNPPISTMPGRMKVFKKVLDHFKKSIQEGDSWNLGSLITQIYHNVYKYKDLEYPAEVHEPRNYALNLSLMEKSGGMPEEGDTLEIRGLEGQKNMDEFLLIIRMFNNRINYLEKNLGNEVIPYFGIESPQPPASKLKKDVSNPDRVKAQFESYIKSTPGLKWDDYKRFIDEF